MQVDRLAFRHAALTRTRTGLANIAAIVVGTVCTLGFASSALGGGHDRTQAGPALTHAASPTAPASSVASGFDECHEGTIGDAALSVTAQDGPVTGAEGDGPQWECDFPEIRAADVWRGNPIICDFEFRNAGSENLTIEARGG